MGTTKVRVKRRARPAVRFSNTAATMVSSLFESSETKTKAAIKIIEADITDPTKVRKLPGYDNVFVARGHGMRVIFAREGESSVVTAVSAEA